jgi:hypothetical protein
MRNQIKPSPIDPNALFIFEDKELEKGLWTIMYKVKGRNSDGTIDYKKLLIGVAYKSNPSIIKLPFLRYFDYLDETGTPFASYDDLINAFGTLLGLGASAVAGNPAGSDKQVQFNDAGSFAGDTEFLFNKATKALTVGTSTEEASAIGNFDSTTQGFLVPRMTTAQKNAIVSPVNGLQVYDTDLNEWQYYNGTSWVADTTTPAGNNMEIQYNDSGSFGASNKFTWDNDNRYLNISTEAFNQYYRIKLGLDVGFGIIGSGLIEKIGNSTFYGAVADGNRTGFSVPGNTSGSGSGRIIPLSDLGLNLDFGSSSTSQRWGTIYSLNVDTSTSLSSVRHIVGSPNSDQSAIFLVNSTTQGVLMPRMTTAQRDAIATPSVSLLIYNTTTNKYEYNNTPLQTSGLLTIGKVYHIYDYNVGDDFTNVGAASNATGEIFTATGTTPTTWTNGSSLGIPDENWITMGANAVGGNDTEIQYNNAGFLDGDSGNVWDNVNKKQTISDIPGTTGWATEYDNAFVRTERRVFGNTAFFNYCGAYGEMGGSKTGVDAFDFAIGQSGNSGIDSGSAVLVFDRSAGDIFPLDFSSTNLGRVTEEFNNIYATTARLKNIRVATTSDEVSALVQIDSTSKGMLIPRMTTVERDAIVTPAVSLLIFNTTTNQYEFNNTPLQTSGLLTIGKVYHIYDYQAGDDFTNVGAALNQTGQVFTATGTTPATWTNGSSLGIPSENWNPLGGSSPLAVTQTVASVSDNRMVKTDGAGRVIQETGVTLTDGNQIIGDNIFEETEQTASFTLTGSMASKHIDLNSATDAILTFPQQTTEALDSGYYVSVTNKNIGVWTIAVEGSDTLQGVDIVKQNETALIKLDAAGSPQNITVIGGHITVLDNLMRFVDTVADQDYTVLLEGLQPGKITSIITQSDSGTCTLTGKINGVALGGTANSVSTLTTTQTHTTSNTFGIGDKLLFTISANVACVGMSVQFNIEYD